MHKCYQSVLPSTNKLLKKRWDDKYYDEHRRLVRNAAPMVDTKPPRTYMHLHLKLKKLQLEEERLATIERDNKILLEKMSYIMRTKGRVDNRNTYDYKSLNREKRMRELLRVTKENQEILKRITERKPEYDHSKWQRDWDDNQRFMDNIAAYPKNWWQKDKSSQGSQPNTARSAKSSSRSRTSAKSSSKPRSKVTSASGDKSETEQDNTIREEEEEQLNKTEDSQEAE